MRARSKFGTEDQGWVAHFLPRALSGAGVSVYGDGRQVRDVLHVADAVRAWRLLMQAVTEGPLPEVRVVPNASRFAPPARRVAQPMVLSAGRWWDGARMPPSLMPQRR